MKGIILAGGFGTRLYPLTKVISKQLLPVYNKQMIWYPLQTLISSGITDILIISDERSIPHYTTLFGTGESLGISVSYKVQPHPRGLPEAFIIGKEFIGNDSVALILGDNIFEHDFSEDIRSFVSGGRIFAKEVKDPERFGVVTFDADMKVVSIEEKPASPQSPYAIPGLYIYDSRVVSYAENLQPSARGELEIVDLHKMYLQEKSLDVRVINGKWFDAGTFDSLMEAGRFIQDRQLSTASHDGEGAPRVAVLTVTYGSRHHYLTQVIERVMKDRHVHTFVIVDNGSSFYAELMKSVEKYGDKVVILRNEKNIGSAGGFARGLEYVRTLPCDDVLILDDDNVPEMDIRKLLQDTKTVLVANRPNVPGAKEYFTKRHLAGSQPAYTFFESISWEKVKKFFNLARHHTRNEHKDYGTLLVVPNQAFVYGGTFLPMSAVREAPLPDKDLVLYGDDVEYSWGVRRAGYSSYLCYSPKVYDLEVSFGEGSQAVGLFDPKSAAFKTYYRIRNMVRISVRNSPQSRVVLFCNIAIWITALSILGVLKYGLTSNYYRKLRLILQGVYGGYVPAAPLPQDVVLP